MAHGIRINLLAEKLVDRLLDRPKDGLAVRQAKQRALRGLKDQRYPRTNQFQVKSQLAGLVEKFSVRNRDDLADALQARLDELPAESSWVPEALSLILNLSNQPLENQDLVFTELSPQDQEQDAPLTWKQILDDDPWNEEDIWRERDVDYHSSADENDDEHADDQVSVSTRATTVDDEDFAALARQCMIRPDPSALEPIAALQAEFGSLEAKQDVYTLSEASLIQETLNMLQGHPSRIFSRSSTNALRRRFSIRLAGTSHTTIDTLLDQLASLGSRLGTLRGWLSKPSNLAPIQSIQRFISHEFSLFSAVLYAISVQISDASTSNVVSIISLRHRMDDESRTLLHFATVIENASIAASKADFAIIDVLYDETCLAQSCSDGDTFLRLCTCFLTSLNLYLAQVRPWAAKGSPDGHHATASLVKPDETNGRSSYIGPRTFVLRTQSNGDPFSPKCLHRFVSSILRRTESFEIRRLLETDVEHGRSIPSSDSGVLLVEICVAEMRVEPLIPFPQFLDAKIRLWMDEWDGASAMSVGEMLWRTPGVKQAISQIPVLFFASNGAAFNEFATVLFEKLRSSNETIDTFLLTELAQVTIGASCSDLARDGLSISVVALTKTEVQICPHTITERLGQISLNYVVPWPVRLVTNGGLFDAPNKVFCGVLRLMWTRQNIASCWNLIQQAAKTVDYRYTFPRPLIKLKIDLAWLAGILHAHITTWAAIHHGETMKRMAQAADVDQMSEIWSSFAEKLEMDLLMRKNMSPIQNAIVELLNLSWLLKEKTLQLLSSSSPDYYTAASPCRHGNIVNRSFEDLNAAFDKLHAFVAAGVRSAARATGSAALDGLADALNAR